MIDFASPEVGYFKLNESRADGTLIGVTIALLSDGTQAALSATVIRQAGWSTVVAVNDAPVGKPRPWQFWRKVATTVKPGDTVTVEQWNGQRRVAAVTEIRDTFFWFDYE